MARFNLSQIMEAHEGGEDEDTSRLLDLIDLTTIEYYTQKR